MNITKAYIGLGAGVLIIIALTVFLLVPQQPKDSMDVPVDEEKPAQTGPKKIDDHLTIDETLRDVNFCGKTYQTTQVIINGVDVIERFAYLVENDLIPATLKIEGNSKYKSYTVKEGEYHEVVCTNLSYSESDGIIHSSVMAFPSSDEEQNGEKMYRVNTNSFFLVVNAETNEIFEIDDYGLHGPLGALK